MSDAQDRANKKSVKKLQLEGFRRISAWIPPKYKDEFLNFAKQLRNRHRRKIKEEQENGSNKV